MIGQTISHYRILAKLGEGGMGVVYKAKDTKLKRTVALKFLPPDSTRDLEAKARFIHEARAASALDHPNVCTIHEIDETAHDQMFIVMACYEGETLQERIARGPLPWQEAFDITMQIARGLAAAHARGIVHRDIKPANIMVTCDGQVKILDFGVVKLTGQTRVTRTGMKPGTIAYMSPEQIQGELIDARTDVWSLGILLHEMATGEHPYQGDYEAAMIYQIVHAEPELDLEARHGVPAALESILIRMLARPPAERYANASELLDDLESFVAGSVISPVPPRHVHPASSRHHLLTTFKRRPLALFLIGLALAVASWLIAGKYLRKSPQSELALVVIGFQDLMAPEDQATAVGMTELVNIGLAGSSPMRVISPEYLYDLRRRFFGVTGGAVAEDQALELARRANATHLLTGRFTELEDQKYVIWRLVDTINGKNLAGKRAEVLNSTSAADLIIADAIPVLAECCGASVEVTPLPVAKLTSQSPLAYRHYVEGLIALRANQLQESIAALQQATAIDTTFALAYFALSRIHANIYGGTRDFAATKKFSDQAWEHRAHLSIKDRMRLEAWRARVDFNSAEARGLYREVLERWPDDHDALADYTDNLWNQWYFREAMAVTKEAAQLYPEDTSFLSIYQQCLSIFGRFDEALAVAKRCSELQPRILGHWHQLCATYLQMGLPDSAETAAQQALKLDDRSLLGQLDLGHCAYSRRDLPAAIALLQAIYAREDLISSGKIRVLTASSFRPSLSMLYAAAGRYQEALECFEMAKQYTDKPLNRIAVDGRRWRALLRMERPREVLLDIAEVLVQEGGIVTLFNVKMNEPMALALVDSFDAAWAALRALTATEEAVGGFARYAALKNRAEIQLAAGDPDSALQTVHEIRTNGVPRGGMLDIDLYQLEAKALSAAGRPQQAIEVMRGLLRLYGGYARAHYDLGRLYEAVGRDSDASAAYRAFLDMWIDADEGIPQLEEARRRLVALNGQN